ncbi:HTH-type transcriptional regulator TtgR [Saezia sanguinis]|uniref:HTH-type transcriptional regulator TtgR n=1 Tax=Saezia sanguinis TaxID=1965230 RepID=A0A433SA84_9BURK|nr:TetR/AcrR family transcriptional regulator [Saezia sanguinis]RUS65648.1 HTH-type transcriptional regulator TtgR [Saezia sanguinis]
MKQHAENAYQRKKQPERVRAQLLEACAHMILAQGVAGLTLDAVAQMAGVSKGGLLHHFASKQALLDALYNELLEQMDAQVSNAMKKDPLPFGSFSRAYITVNTTGSSQKKQARLIEVMMLESLSQEKMRQCWDTWLEQRLQKSGPEERSAHLMLARYAADGLWLNDLMHTAQPGARQRKSIIRQLLAMTLPAQETEQT